MLKAIIFDLDNTLVNFWQFKKEASHEAAKAMVSAGLTMSPERAEALIFNIYKTHGVEYQLTFSELIKPFGYPKLEFERIRDAGVVAYLRKKEQVLKPYSGVVETLAELGKSYKLGVLTDAPREQSKQRLAVTGLSEYFEAVGTFHETNVMKPGAEPFLAICKKMGVEPVEALMVGDNPARDMAGAKAVGMRTCLAKYDPYFEDEGPKADFEIEKPLELLDIVKRIK